MSKSRELNEKVYKTRHNSVDGFDDDNNNLNHKQQSNKNISKPLKLSDSDSSEAESDNNSIDYTLYILNEKNKLITKEFIHGLLSKYGIKYKIKNLALFQRAMTHDSYIIRDFKNDKIVKLVREKAPEPIDPKDIKNAIPLQTESYERQEYLGDSMLHLVLADYLYNRYPDKDEGFMTKLRTKIENGETLANLARVMQLHEYVLLARYIECVGGRNNNNHIFEDAFESFLGALFKDTDKNYALCEQFVINVIETNLDFAHMIYNESNYKDLLLQYHHKMKWTDPLYSLVCVIDEGTKRKFNMCVKGGNGISVAGVGIANSKRAGEQKAAYDALVKYGVVGEDSDDEGEVYE